MAAWYFTYLLALLVVSSKGALAECYGFDEPVQCNCSINVSGSAPAIAGDGDTASHFNVSTMSPRGEYTEL